jgi:hypothetical protein
MTIEVKLLEPDDGGAYDVFVASCSACLIYNTRTYLRFLSSVLKDCLPIVFVGRRDGNIVGSIACMLSSAEIGVVLNSLPYFGSHGDVLISDDELNPIEVVSKIIAALVSFCREQGVGAINIVAHPLRPQISHVASNYRLEKWAHRVGQISLLPKVTSRDDANASVLQACTQKTRNLVRKGLRGNFEICVSRNEDDWWRLAEFHRLGMERIGGTAKSLSQFLALRDVFEPERMSRLYVAKYGSEFAGGLLILRYRNWIEYFTPVAAETFRNEQVLSALIAVAMSDAMMEGASYWNWGGTWPSQAGVYHFKKGWGALDHPYSYYGTVRDERLDLAEPSVLLKAFPTFFVKPFHIAQESRHES